MEIKTTKKALEYFHDRGIKFVRVAARDTFECSTMVEFYLQEGKERPSDAFVLIDGITFMYDEKARDEIGSEVKIDFIDSQGLKLLAPRGTLAYAQKVRSAEWMPEESDSIFCGR